MQGKLHSSGHIRPLREERMKILVFVLLIALSGLTWWKFKRKMATTAKLVILTYLAISVYRLATGVDRDQQELLAISFAVFAGLWIVTWLITWTAARRS